ncbi:MAG: GspE/PulE family protein [Desulfohalobiaceae bacterium]
MSTQNLQAKLDYQTRLNRLYHVLHEADSFVQVLPEVEKEILAILDAERLTIYQRDIQAQAIVSKYKTGDEIQEIRLPLSFTSIAGFVALTRQPVLIPDVYDQQALQKIHPKLGFNQSYDQRTGLRTRSMLAVPISFKQTLLGVLQVMNKQDGGSFCSQDLQQAQELARIIGQKFHYQFQATQSEFDYLLQQQRITPQQLEQARQSAQQQGSSVASILSSDFQLSPQEVGRSLELFYQVPFHQFDPGITPPAELMQNLNLAYLKNSLWVPIAGDQEKAVILLADPNNSQTVQEIQQALGAKSYEFQVALREDILAYLEGRTRELQQGHHQDQDLKEVLQRLVQDSCIQEEQEISDAGGLPDENESSVIQLVNQLISRAIKINATDIHIEPGPGNEGAGVRMRVDGVCQEVLQIPASHVRPVIARIKIMSRLDIAERRKPQDGKIKAKLRGQPVELRVATLPTVHGEAAVLRVLTSSKAMTLQELNLAQTNQDRILGLISRPHGILLVVGPTGSGKTTTLHALLGRIKSAQNKIWTAEDPVEITQPGLQQVQVNPGIGFDFAAALRSFLRADPDVILIGEMRDQETARIGLEASLTGHLVFSTLHTNSAPETITRLLGLGLDPLDFADALQGVLAQRLVRTLCPECKKPYTPEARELEQLANMYGDQEAFQKLAGNESGLALYQPQGCPACAHLGYKGRTGIHELLVSDPEIKALISQGKDASQLRQQAFKQGMTSLVQDGVQKILQGQTDLAQLRLICAQ